MPKVSRLVLPKATSSIESAAKLSNLGLNDFEYEEQGGYRYDYHKSMLNSSTTKKRSTKPEKKNKQLLKAIRR